MSRFDGMSELQTIMLSREQIRWTLYALARVLDEHQADIARKKEVGLVLQEDYEKTAFLEALISRFHK